jgi:hypothetical protein
LLAPGAYARLRQGFLPFISFRHLERKLRFLIRYPNMDLNNIKLVEIFQVRKVQFCMGIQIRGSAVFAVRPWNTLTLEAINQLVYTAHTSDTYASGYQSFRSGDLTCT